MGEWDKRGRGGYSMQSSTRVVDKRGRGGFIIFPHIVISVYYFYFCLMNLADNIKVIREKQGLLQKEVALHIGVDKSTYSKIEKGLREVTVAELQKLTKLFSLTADQIMNYNENIIPTEVVIEDKSTVEQMQLIQQLDEEDKSTVFKIIDKMLTTKKFKDFFNKNVAML